ncbi:MAG: lipase family protein [Aquabacterium sp.]|nr:lipase family protein [Aquabacterium sp.]
MNRMYLRQSGRAALLAAVALAVSSAYAAPSVGPDGPAFYTLPSPMPTGTHGDLLSYRVGSASLGPGAPSTNAWNVLYQSNDAVGATNVVSGTVLVPAAPWSGSGARPVILYAASLHGSAQDCASSRQFEKGSDYENSNIVAALKAGYAVLVSDYQGYITGDAPTTLMGRSQGKAVLDLFKAATAIPASGISASAKVAIWGYNQGGQSAAWSAELQPAYAPEVNLVGVAAGGVPPDMVKVAPELDGNLGAAFLFDTVNGLAQQYPRQVPLKLLTTPEGKQVLADLKTQCLFKQLFYVINKPFSYISADATPLSEVIDLPMVNASLDAHTLGRLPMTVPFYQYHGQADEFIPISYGFALKKDYCSKFKSVTFDVFPAEHIITQFQAAPFVLSWLADRFAGKPAPGSCDITKPDPVSTANPGRGNYVVSLKSWPLTARVGLKTLNQTINLPASSTFTADADVSAKRLTGSLNVPEFTAKVKILGITTDIKLVITQVGPIEGTAELDENGLLHVHGHAYANMRIKSVGILGINLPFGCKTSTPIDFPVNFDGPLSAMGDGNLGFSGTTTFPKITGCGLFSPIFSVLMSGPGQTYSFVAAPPAPTKW